MDFFYLWLSLFDCACFSILLIFGVYVMFRSERGCSEVPPRNGWTPCLEQSIINCVLNLVACLWQVLSVTVFIWMRLIFHSFDFACLRDVPFQKRLYRSSSQEWVNPGASSSHWFYSVLNHWICLWQVSSVEVVIWMRLFFDPFICVSPWCSVPKEVFLTLLPVMSEPL